MAAVCLWKTPDILPAETLMSGIGDMLTVFGGAESLVKQGDTVLIKPDCADCTGNIRYDVTAAILVEAAVMLAAELGAAKIIIGEKVLPGQKPIDNFHLAGYDKIAEKYGAVCRDLGADEQFYLELAQPLALNGLYLPRTLAEGDAVISLPKLNASGRSFNCAAANIANLISADDAAAMLQIPSRGLLDYCTAVTPAITIVDAVDVAILNKKRRLNGIAVGTDGFAVDTVCAAMVGVNPASIEYLLLAEQYGLGCANPSQIKLYGENLLNFME